MLVLMLMLMLATIVASVVCCCTVVGPISAASRLYHTIKYIKAMSI